MGELKIMSDIKDLTLKVNELFYSIQGEGARVGTPTFFIRLSGCSAAKPCRASGVICDTNWSAGERMSLEQIYLKLQTLSRDCRAIVWTGGEPTDQLRDEHVAYFADQGYFQSIETSGINPAPRLLDWITLSPKVSDELIQQNFPEGVDEIKFIVRKESTLPACPVPATYKFLSPMFDGMAKDDENVLRAILLVCQNPDWKLSVQMHKFIGVA
jgi:7-carboxy-7-deazaguanine synthase